MCAVYKLLPITITNNLQAFSFQRYFPYDPLPESLKRKTDEAFALLDKLQKLQVNETDLKAREGKALSQVHHENIHL